MPEPFVVRPHRAGAQGADARDAGPAARTPAPAATGDAPAAPRASAARRAPLPEHPLLDPLRPHLADPDVTDVFLNGPDRLYVDRGEGPVRVESWRADEESVRAIAVALVSLGDRHLDDAAPCVDVRLPSGARVHAVLPPISTAGTLVSLRIPLVEQPSLGGLAERGTLSDATRAWLESLVARRENVLITGAAGSGKTTLLAALLGAAPPSDRIVTIEDVAELRIRHPHRVALEARQANLEGAGGVGLARLVREALRMRPDRLVVGECRGEEVRELLSALNTGHDGGAGTLHANGLDDVPARLEALGALAGLDDRALARQAVSAIGWVLHLARDVRGIRRLVGAGRLSIMQDRLAIEAIEPWAC